MKSKNQINKRIKDLKLFIGAVIDQQACREAMACLEILEWVLSPNRKRK